MSNNLKPSYALERIRRTSRRRVNIDSHRDSILVSVILNVYAFADIPFPKLFLVSWIATTIVMITSLCGVRFRRRPQSSSKDGKEKDSMTYKSKITETAAVAIAATPQANGEVELDDAKAEIPQSQELPLPPARKHLNESHSYNHLPRAVSTKNNLKMNLSVKIPRSRSVSKHRQDDKKEKLKREDSIWTKTIILGEKCRVPDDDDDAIIYDNQGNRISTYRARTPRSLTVSRTNSMIDQDAIPSQ